MIKFTHHETVFEDGVEVHRFKPFLNTISNESRARILQDMNDGLDQMTDFQIAGTTRLLSFESLYRCVYNAILKNLGVEWHRKVEECAKRLAIKFRNNQDQFFRCAQMFQEVSLFAEATFCFHTLKRINVVPTFATAWDDFEESVKKDGIAYVLWKPARNLFTKIAAHTLFMQLYDDISHRPNNSGYQKCLENFSYNIKVESRKRALE